LEKRVFATKREAGDRTQDIAKKKKKGLGNSVRLLKNMQINLRRKKGGGTHNMGRGGFGGGGGGGGGGNSGSRGGKKGKEKRKEIGTLYISE